MISLPIWLFVIMCVLSFFGLILVVFTIIGIATEKGCELDRIADLESEEND